MTLSSAETTASAEPFDHDTDYAAFLAGGVLGVVGGDSGHPNAQTYSPLLLHLNVCNLPSPDPFPDGLGFLASSFVTSSSCVRNVRLRICGFLAVMQASGRPACELEPLGFFDAQAALASATAAAVAAVASAAAAGAVAGAVNVVQWQ